MFRSTADDLAPQNGLSDVLDDLGDEATGVESPTMLVVVGRGDEGEAEVEKFGGEAVERGGGAVEYSGTGQPGSTVSRGVENAL